MKKVKVMLLSLALLAVVGGALAFKLKSPVRFCYTTAFQDINNQWTCTLGGETKTCISTPSFLTHDLNPLAVKTSCTTVPIEVEGILTCVDDEDQNIDCVVRTTVKPD